VTKLSKDTKKIDETFARYQDQLYDAMDDPKIQLAMSRAVEAYRKNRAAALKLFPQTIKKAEQLREIKEYSLLHNDELVKQTKDMIEDSKGHCFVAKTPEDARKYISEVVKPKDKIVKGKSFTCEELHLNEFLEEKLGCEVTETDLGEFIIQRLKSKPMHILSPAIHVPKEEVAKLFTSIMGRPIDADIPTLVKEARLYLREAFFNANVGISGANAIAAETGTLFIMENEGNIRLATGLPRKHIAVVGLEKIVPTLQDGLLTVEVACRYANYKAPSYINLISTPSKTGDIEKQTAYGAHGPEELHVVLLDNNRTEMIKDDVYRQALYCLRCGGCFYECSIYPLTAGFFGHLYMGGIGAILTTFLLGGLENAAPIAYTCMLCGRCKEVCPMKIDASSMILKLRERLAKEGMVPKKIQDLTKTIIDKKSLK
jgi:L-lactate dehydrogenase complex protein LldG